MSSSDDKKTKQEKSNTGQIKCDCPHGRMRKFIEPCLLLLLAQEPTYGYDLIDKLDRFGFETPDPGTVYRYLRKLEDKGMVASSWDTDSSGPAKRSYEVTEEGEGYLKAWVIRIEKNRKILGRFLQEFESLEV